MRTLHLITARGGSKGLPGKNFKDLNGTPLFMYSVDFANRNMAEGDVLCISTNDDELMQIAADKGVEIPFKRPEELASDTATSEDVITHALDFYKDQGIEFDALMLLQPTSPFRSDDDYRSMKSKFDPAVDMVVSVKLSKENPYFTLFEEDEAGFLGKSKEGSFQRRQDCPPVYAYNGSIYLMNVNSFRTKGMKGFTKIKKHEMPDSRSVDIDTMADWLMAEYYYDKQQ